MKTFDQFKKDLFAEEDSYKHQSTKYLREKFQECLASFPKEKSPEAASQSVAEAPKSPTSILAELKSMLDSELITQAEFDTKEAEFLTLPRPG